MERERAQLTAHRRHRLGLCTGTLSDVQRKRVRLQFPPELIQLCGSFSPVLGCVDKELVLFPPALIKRHGFI